MSCALARATCVFALLTSASSAQSLLDQVTLRIEIAADPNVLNINGTLPAEVVDSINSGDVDLRHLVMYDAPARQLSVRTFMVPGGSPAPTSLVVVGNAEVTAFRVDVSNIVLDRAMRTIAFEGAVAAETYNFGHGAVHGAVAGGAFRLTAHYDGAAERFVQMRMNLDCCAQTLSTDGTGFLKVETVPNRPPVVDAGPTLIESFMTEVLLDALKSSDPDGEELDYKWHVIAGSATLRGCETPTPIFQLVQGQGAYEIRVTVTDPRGASSYAYVRIMYVGR